MSPELLKRPSTILLSTGESSTSSTLSSTPLSSSLFISDSSMACGCGCGCGCLRGENLKEELWGPYYNEGKERGGRCGLPARDMSSGARWEGTEYFPLDFVVGESILLWDSGHWPQHPRMKLAPSRWDFYYSSQCSLIGEDIAKGNLDYVRYRFVNH